MEKLKNKQLLKTSILFFYTSTAFYFMSFLYQWKTAERKHIRYSLLLFVGAESVDAAFQKILPSACCVCALAYNSRVGRAIAQAVSPRARAQVSPCGICGGHSDAGTSFSPIPSVLPCQ
jgi:hypothetical protein